MNEKASQSLQPIAANTGDFRRIRTNGQIYVDKTQYLYNLITDPSLFCYFLARPRRFGKSLMISTLKELFQGNRELFDGLAISRTDWQWDTYPVMHFNFGFAAARDYETFIQMFPGTVQSVLVEAGYSYDSSKLPAENFGDAIDRLYKTNGGKGVVILIDEYDDPVARALDNPDDAEKIRDALAPFYGQMKDRSGKIRFLMITGVSKFTKMSVFSALSNLVDISFKDDYATMLGFTEEEITAYFAPHMRLHAEKMGISYEEYREKLKKMFNGYRFGKLSRQSVYNPVSTGLNFANREPFFESTWTETGRPSMLMNYLKRDELLALDYNEIENVSDSEFDVSDIRRLKPVAMLFQTGYLTIRDFEPFTQMFTLGVPDDEVRRDLGLLMASVASETTDSQIATLGAKLLTGKWNDVFAGLKAIYAHLPYGSTEFRVAEFSYQRSLCCLLDGAGIHWRAEDVQANGRADIVAEHPCGVYIFELKVDESAEAALAQVKAKGYHAPYLGKGCPIYAIGLNFDSKTHLLTDARAERINA